MFCRSKSFRRADKTVQLRYNFALIIDQQLGIAHHVNEQNVRNLQLEISFTLRHVAYNLGHHCSWLVKKR